MRWLLVVCPLLLMLAGTAAAAADGTEREARIAAGALSGTVADGVAAFKGIPYAAPPTGDRRWRPPAPAASWQGVRPATAFGPDCVHEPDPGDQARSTVAHSEDCLYLNVWTPDATPRPVPVLVWIHGGGYATGGSSAGIYDGARLARRGLVVVSLNYRLGRFGFFAHPALKGEGAIGNFAYMDMIAALEWVRDNIEAFGGDPATVTLMGESAGGDAVAHLMTSPRAAGLFQRAVILSGNGRDHLRGGLPLDAPAGEPSAMAVGVAFAESVGIRGTGPEALAALRALPPQTLFEGMNLYGLLTRPDFQRTHVMGPIEDGDIVLGSPGELLRRNGAAMPVLVGSTSEDLPTTLPPPDDPLSYFASDRDVAAEVYAAAGAADPRTLTLMVGADISMNEPARFVAREVARSGRPSYLYRFGYVAESLRKERAGAPHSSELPFLFGTLDIRYGPHATEGDRRLSALFGDYVASFARTGDPNGDGRPPWPRHDRSAEKLMLFAREGGASFEPDPFRPRLDLVARVADAELNGVPDDLVGTTWRWTRFTSPIEDVEVESSDRYTLTFLHDRIAIRADCNRGSAAAGSPEPGALRVGLMATTRAACPAGSRSEEFVRDVARAARYRIEGGQLILDLPADAGTMRLDGVDRSAADP